MAKKRKWKKPNRIDIWDQGRPLVVGEPHPRLGFTEHYHEYDDGTRVYTRKIWDVSSIRIRSTKTGAIIKLKLRHDETKTRATQRISVEGVLVGWGEIKIKENEETL